MTRIAAWWTSALKLLALVAFGLWTLVTYSVAKEIGQPFAGFRFEESLSVSPQNDTGWNGPRAGLLSYDRLITANGARLERSEDLKRIVRASPPGTPITYTLLRQDKPLTLTIETQVLGGWDFARAFLPTLLNGLLHLLVGAWAFWLRPAHPAAQAHLLMTIAIGVLYQVLGVDFTMAHWFTPLYVMGGWFLAATALHFALVFPTPLPIVGKHPWLQGLVYLPALLLALANLATYRPINHVLAQALLAHPPNLLPIWGGWTALGFMALLTRMILASGWARAPQARNQARIVLAGLLAAYLPSVLVYVLPVIAQQTTTLSIAHITLAYGCFLIFPLSVGYAVLKYQLFGITRAVRKTLTYAAVTAVVSVLYFLLLAASREGLGLHSQAANLLTFLTLTVIFAPLYQRIQAVMDRLFALSSVAAQKVAAEFGQAVQNERDPERLLELFAAKTYQLLNPDFLAVYLHREGADLELARAWGSPSDLPAHMSPDHPRLFRAEALGHATVLPERSLDGIEEHLFLPLRTQGDALGCLVIGPSRSGYPYEESERLFLVTMAQQLAVWLRNAQLFDHLSRRNEELERANQHLKELDRLKGDFLNAASHELRTPLASIRGYAEFLEDGFGGPVSAEQQEFIQEIQLGVLRLQRLVDDLLDFARLEAGSFSLDPQNADLRDGIGEVIRSLIPQALVVGVKLEMELPSEPLMVRMDARRIEQVLLNLVGNALKFTPAQGRVTVSVRRQEGELRVEVSDTGIGIPEELLPRLFEKFFQVDAGTTRAYGGTGLGLSIAKSLVEAHGGSIGVRSIPGHGSVFWFTLPAVGEVSQAAGS